LDDKPKQRLDSLEYICLPSRNNWFYLEQVTGYQEQS
jgi:hypothetical protein